MTTREFLDSLVTLGNRPLRWYPGTEPVPGGYHVTEIKSVSVQSMDCGGAAAQWRETVLQVLPPSGASAASPMSVAKFLSIFDRVASAVPIADDAHVRVEYGEIGAPAIGYLVQSVDVEEDGVAVRLRPPAVACKGSGVSLGDVPVLLEPVTLSAPSATGGCCGAKSSPSVASACCA